MAELPPAPAGVNVEGAEQYTIPQGIANRQLTGITWVVDTGWYWLIQSLFVEAAQFDSSVNGTAPHVAASDQDDGVIFDCVGTPDTNDESAAWWVAGPGMGVTATGRQGSTISLPRVWLPPMAVISFYITTDDGNVGQADTGPFTLVVTRAQYTGVTDSTPDVAPAPTPVIG